MNKNPKQKMIAIRTQTKRRFDLMWHTIALVSEDRVTCDDLVNELMDLMDEKLAIAINE